MYGPGDTFHGYRLQIQVLYGTPFGNKETWSLYNLHIYNLKMSSVNIEFKALSMTYWIVFS